MVRPEGEDSLLMVLERDAGGLMLKSLLLHSVHLSTPRKRGVMKMVHRRGLAWMQVPIVVFAATRKLLSHVMLISYNHRKAVTICYSVGTY